MKFIYATKIALLLSFLALSSTIAAQDSSNSWIRSGTLQFGIDAWKINPSVDRDYFYGPFPQDYDLSHTMLAMPSSDTKWHYRPTSPWYKFQGSISPNQSLVFSTYASGEHILPLSDL